ncbi:hypothetical protein F441_04490 [Phytophthora nicotianae CJ01A1]|uniref:Uncharacterized protein n=6 Tax=Phytophthora nicotianae TaxID=4792 RepID=W2QJR9_PHYN3|nr:hypothetical protein PPTG_22408 [Phytophthora nicotianae INRA-310]ETI52318.1 hypothetical protein F443_04514 [Phytophthora nicotianae P1569]ETK92206.1 hypothetical protein L915_04387 [Phytophthora nicotianae]ETO81085.1 hypothetical protein F444_04541 [Phytophthora nicotianae P1976]ETP22135.1 hypothetical protein F441_04490 [Phytophthora nicotianae CJ01A1]ETP50027.1 hypothetical protein F442_04555 [Phytophthora nicotianae P10297]
MMLRGVLALPRQQACRRLPRPFTRARCPKQGRRRFMLEVHASVPPELVGVQVA